MDPAADPSAPIPPRRRPSPQKFVKDKRWTALETEHLIYEAYCYSHKHGGIQQPHQWEEIAVILSSGPSPTPRSGTQCCRKMEQLSRLYRKQDLKAQPEAMCRLFRLMDQLEHEDQPIPLSSHPPASKAPAAKGEVEEGGSGERGENVSIGEKGGNKDEEEKEEVAEQEVRQREQENVFGMSSNGKRRMGEGTTPAKTQNVSSGGKNVEPTRVHVPMNPVTDPPAPIPPCQQPSPPEVGKVTPWKQKEMECLILEEKWFRQKCGPIREPHHWERIAGTVSSSLGPGGTGRSGTECRSKMEQLRKHYRKERRQHAQPEAMPPLFWLMYRLEREDLPLAEHRMKPKAPAEKGEVEKGCSGESKENASIGEKEGEEEGKEEEEEVAEQEVRQRKPENVFGMNSNGKKRMGEGIAPAKSQNVSSGGNNSQPTCVHGRGGTGEERRGEMAAATVDVEEEEIRGGKKRGGAGEERRGEKAATAAAATVDVEEEDVREGEAEWRARAALELVDTMQKIDEGFASVDRRHMELMREFEKGWMETEAKRAAMMHEFEKGWKETEAKRAALMYEFEKGWKEMETKRAVMMHESRRCLLDLVTQAFRPAAKRARR